MTPSINDEDLRAAWERYKSKTLVLTAPEHWRDFIDRIKGEGFPRWRGVEVGLKVFHKSGDFYELIHVLVAYEEFCIAESKPIGPIPALHQWTEPCGA